MSTALKQISTENNGDYAKRIVESMNVPDKFKDKVISEIVFMLASRSLLNDIEKLEFDVVKSGNSYKWSRNN